MPIIDENFIPRQNGYICMECRGIYAAVELAKGNGPMLMTCFRDENCGGQAISMGYPEGSIPLDVPVLIEFFTPTQEDIEARGITHHGLIKHFNEGGLMRRATDEAPDWVKALV